MRATCVRVRPGPEVPDVQRWSAECICKHTAVSWGRRHTQAHRISNVVGLRSGTYCITTLGGCYKTHLTCQCEKKDE